MSQSQPPGPSIPPTLPKSSSGAPYIAAIVVLLALIGGLVWYKLRPAETPPAPPPSASAPVVPSNTAPVIDIPAPPEMDAEVEAGTDAGERAVSSGQNLCAGPCGADAPQALRTALSGTGAAARGCYERALRTNSTLQGRMTVTVRVASNGNVCSATVGQNELNAADVTSCVVGLFRGKHFPAPTGGRCVDVNVPLSFTPRDKK